jgi:sugar-specific transcriptional regulator TrmB
MWTGLTYTQAKAYLTLLELGPSSTKTISNVSKISQPDTYRIMYRLHEQGLVEKIIATPSLFKALPIEEFISEFVKRKDEERSRMLSELMALKDVYKTNNVPQEEPQFIIIPPKEPLRVRISHAIKNAKKSVDILSLNGNLMRGVHYLGEATNKSLKKEIPLRIITDEPQDKEAFQKNIQLWLQYNNFNLRTTLLVPVQFFIIDKKNVFIETAKPGGFLESPRLYTNNESLTMIINSYFEYMWSKSKKVNYSPLPRRTSLIKSG